MTFHWYGFIVGLSVSIVLQGMEQIINQSKIRAARLQGWRLVGLLLFVLVPARLWHVVTDWQLYGQFNWEVLAVWRGGLSILGAVAAGIIGLWWMYPVRAHRLVVLDALALWLPLGQAVGRMANWINQELYGLPTTVPWKIFIAPERRLAGFETYQYFHPLFAYEAIGTSLLAGGLWYLHRRRGWQVGEGKLLQVYLHGYLCLRFLLDFLRVDRSHEWYGLGVNQWIVLGVEVVLLIWLLLTIRHRRYAQQMKIGVAAALAVIGLISLGLSTYRTRWFERNITSTQLARQLIAQQLLVVPDLSVQEIVHRDKTVRVVVANTATSQQRGLSNTRQLPEQGMMFVFNQPARHLFWMKDMSYPLDFIWFRDGKVVDLHTDVPAPAGTIADQQLPRYAPRLPADMMLEVTAGTVESDNWQIGDVILLKTISQ